MPKIKLVISDLHLADSHSIFEGFGDLQQSALEGLLSATSKMALLTMLMMLN